jgi:hypothetical protein
VSFLFPRCHVYTPLLTTFLPTPAHGCYSFDTTQVCRLKAESGFSQAAETLDCCAMRREQRLCPAGINSTGRMRKKGILRVCGMTEAVKE